MASADSARDKPRRYRVAALLADLHVDNEDSIVRRLLEVDSKLDKIERRLIVLLGEQPGGLEKFLDFEKRFEGK